MKINKGITLIALVVTIIVLIILAGVSISLVLGENGIIQKAKLGRRETEKASAKERIEMEVIGSYNGEGELLAKNIINNIKKNIPEASIEGEEFPLRVKLEKDIFIIYKDGKVEYLRPIALIKNIKITQEDNTVIPEGGVEAETKLKIEFDISIEGGTIQEVTPGILENGKVTYITDGIEEKVEFKIVSIVDGKTSDQTETIELESYYKKLLISETVKVGDFVNYSVGNWTQQDIEKLGILYFGEELPTSDYKFGGFKIGSLKDNSVNANGINPYSEGWRVLAKNENGTVKIVHAGTSEGYYQSSGENNAYRSQAILMGKSWSKYLTYATGQIVERNWSMYEDCSTDSVNTNYAIKNSAHCMTYEEALNITGSESGTSNNLRKISEYYLSSARDNQGLQHVNSNGTIGARNNQHNGIRPVVTLKAEIQVKAKSGQTTHVTPETAWQLKL